MSCHSASVRSEVYRIRSVLRECIYIVQTKIADFIDAFWVFKQALRRSLDVFAHPECRLNSEDGTKVAVNLIMQVIHANCRVQFTAGDMDFIAAVLGKKKESMSFLVSLLSDM